MKLSPCSRRSFLARTAVIGGGAALGCRATGSQEPKTPASSAPSTLALHCAPKRVFKAQDPGKEGTESWFANLVLQAPDDGPWRTDSLEIEMRSGGSVVSRTTTTGPALAALRTELPGGRTPSFPFTLRIRGNADRSAKVDAIGCAVLVRGPKDAPELVRIDVPLLEYDAKTALVFPFRGRGLITQGGANDGGHVNRSGQFAVDAIGLSETYAPQSSDEETNESACGWGREILAPAAGVISKVRADRPDQPVPGTTNEEFLLPEFKGGGDPGNHVVIDHENGEFSLICHLQAGSVRVSAGERVASGDVLGLLGNSGDTSFPHVHYQLMDGADWMRCDALPYRFTNGPRRHVRGTFFDAKG